MVNDSSLGESKQIVFDLDSQKGVTLLLASVRASDISSAHKNELRDLIFLYANGGKDQAIRITLEQKIDAYGVVPLVVEATPTPESVQPPPSPPSAFGTSRPAPSFSAPTAPVVAAAPSPEPAVPPPTPTAEPEVVPAPVPSTNPVVPPSVVASDTPSPIAPPESAKQPPQTIPTPPPAPTATSAQPVSSYPARVQTNEQNPAPTDDYDPNRNLQRIREIKSLVNDRVGNPVNLVDINNDVGREYMSALLDAMKKLNNGSSVISAMNRLETAYLEVDKTLTEHEHSVTSETPTTEVTRETQSTVTPATPPSPEPVEMPRPPVAEVFHSPEPPPLPPVDVPVVLTTKEVEPAKEAPIPVVPAVEQIAAIPALEMDESQPPIPTPPVAPRLPEVSMEPEVVTEAPANVEINKQLVKPIVLKRHEAGVGREPLVSHEPIPIKPTPVKEESSWGPATDTPPKGVVAGVEESAPTKFASLAESKIKPRTPDELPTADSIETSSVVGDSLFTKEIDSGLEQLLLEWSLFRKSGLFGTGPKGREHPLFKKVAGLQIPLLLAGRFEGATQEIKQSITDYMNGWRYEQGIIYNQGETFEHYLRRVIHHILDLQN